MSNQFRYSRCKKQKRIAEPPDQSLEDIKRRYGLWLSIMKYIHCFPIYNRNLSRFIKQPTQIQNYLTNIGFDKLCRPAMFGKYYSCNFINKLDSRLSGSSECNHSRLTFALCRSLQILNNVMAAVKCVTHKKITNGSIQRKLSKIKALKTLQFDVGSIIICNFIFMHWPWISFIYWKYD